MKQRDCIGEGAVSYLRLTRNFAFGCATPVELIANNDGVQDVLNEFGAHAGGGSL